MEPGRVPILASRADAQKNFQNVPSRPRRLAGERPPHQRRKLLDKALDETRLRHQFFVALYGGERRYNDLTKTDSAWIVRLIGEPAVLTVR